MNVGKFFATFFLIFQHELSFSNAQWHRSGRFGLGDRQCCEFMEETAHFGPYVQKITEPFEHSEEPFWDDRVQLLYFVDIHKGLVNSFNPANNQINSIKLDGDVTPVLPTNNLKRFVVGLNKTLILLHWDGRNGSQYTYENLTAVDADRLGNRFNDGKPDKNGVVWVGTMGYENSSGVIPDQATLYKITPDNLNDPAVEIRPVSISNGLAWNSDNTKFYYIDTPTRKIAAYDFDLETEQISNRTIAFDFEKYNISGNPDGMTIDTDNNLFIACFNGGKVIKVNPTTGELLQKIYIPASRVTSVYFGGKYLDNLFVTTSRFGLTDDELELQPAAGSLFVISHLKAKGRPSFYANF